MAGNTIKRVSVKRTDAGYFVNANDIYLHGDVIVDLASPVQRVYQVFGKGEINNENLVYHVRMASTARIMQAGGTCEPTPGSSIEAVQSSTTPCKIKINEAWCNRASGSAILDALVKYMDGTTDESSYERVNRQFFDTLVAQLVQARFLLQAAGGLWGSTIATTAFASGVTQTQQDQFNAMKNLCTGWLKRFVPAKLGDVSSGNDIKLANFVSATGAYDGDVVALYDAFIADAALTKPKLVSFINMGAKVLSDGTLAVPVGLVSNRMYNAITTAYNAQKSQAAQNEMRITRENIANINGINQFVYKIDNTVIMPIDISEFDGLLTGKYEFFYLTVTGNVAVFDSFANEGLMNEDGTTTPVAFELIDGKYMNKKGQVIVDGDMLMATVVGDLDLVTGQAAYIVAA
jgi:hypothetical protein